MNPLECLCQRRGRGWSQGKSLGFGITVMLISVLVGVMGRGLDGVWIAIVVTVCVCVNGNVRCKNEGFHRAGG